MKKLVCTLVTSILVMNLLGCGSHMEETKETSTPTTESIVEINTIKFEGNEMDYVKFGHGEKTFVIIPGLSIHAVTPLGEAIAEAYASFSDAYTVYLFDRSKNITEDYSVEDMANDTAYAMQALGIENADIFGASQGGMIAECIAINHPDLVHKLILGSTLARNNEAFDEVVEEWINLAKNKEEDKLLESFVDHVYSKATLDAYRDTLISSNKGITDEEYERFIILAKACETFDVYDKLDEIKCPTLVIGSKGDKVVGEVGSEELAEKLNAELYLYDENYGHGVYDEASDYKDRCLSFLLEK